MCTDVGLNVYGSLIVKSRMKLSRIVSTASKTVGSRQLQLSQRCQDSVERKTRQILNDTTHPLNVCFQRLVIGSEYP